MIIFTNFIIFIVQQKICLRCFTIFFENKQILKHKYVHKPFEIMSMDKTNIQIQIYYTIVNNLFHGHNDDCFFLDILTDNIYDKIIYQY